MARKRSTAAKRKPRRKKLTHQQKRQRQRIVMPLAMSVDEFCEAHTISRDFFYELLKLGLGPDCMMLRRRRLITFEAAARWRAKREEASAEEMAA
jgi:hypothetical protein